MKYQLLCTFTSYDNMLNTLRDVLYNYEIAFEKIYIFENKENRKEMFYTYNIMNEATFMYNTISIHRKKDYNTFYTINALNELICTINNGVLDKQYQIDWSLYEDTMILLSNNELRKVKLKLKEVFNIKSN